MNTVNNQENTKWWCIYFGQETLGPAAIKRLYPAFKRITNHVVMGENRVFLNVSSSKWSNSLYLFQRKLMSAPQTSGLNQETWQWGTGKSIAEAWVHAKWRTLSPELLPIESITDYLNPFGAKRNSVEETRRIRLLRALAVNSLQDLIGFPEDVLLNQYGVWIAEFAREYFSRPDEIREFWLEKATADSLINSHRPFQLEDWIPDTYLQVG